MNVKIFKYGLLAAIAAITIGPRAFAQDSSKLPAPPEPSGMVIISKDSKSYVKEMDNLKTQMRNLQKQMNDLSLKQRMALSMRSMNKTSSDSFKDFGKNFSGSFNNMVPVTTSTSTSTTTTITNGISLNNNLNDKEYKQKIASGELVEKVKTYSKTYPASSGDELQIANSFGKVVVNTWNKNEFKVDVEMKFSSNDASIVDDMFEGTSISDSKNGSIVSFKTNTWSNRRKGGDSKQSMTINYTVYMPAGNPLDIDNKFGSVTLPDLTGRATLNVQFGNLYAQQLLNKDNDVRLKFTSDNSSSITTFNGGSLKLDYGKLKVGVLNNAEANISFSTINIDRLKTAGDFKVKYGDGFDIGSIDKSVRNLNINASFTKINIDFKNSESFNFDIVTKFGDFDYNDDRAKVTAKTPTDEERGWSSTKTYKGYIGKNNSDGKIVINSSYTKVRFH